MFQQLWPASRVLKAATSSIEMPVSIHSKLLARTRRPGPREPIRSLPPLLAADGRAVEGLASMGGTDMCELAVQYAYEE